jgi:hypothetical protein
VKSAESIISELACSGHLPLSETRTEHSAEYAAILILRGKEEELSAAARFLQAPYQKVRHARKYLEKVGAESGPQLAKAS